MISFKMCGGGGTLGILKKIFTSMVETVSTLAGHWLAIARSIMPERKRVLRFTVAEKNSNNT